MSDALQTPAVPTTCSRNAFWPLLILALSFAVLLAWQVRLSLQQRKLMKNQLTQREEVAQQSLKVQGELKRLVDDLIRFAKYDADAKALLGKYGISQQPEAAPGPAPAP